MTSSYCLETAVLDNQSGPSYFFPVEELNALDMSIRKTQGVLRGIKYVNQKYLGVGKIKYVNKKIYTQCIKR